MNELIIVVVIIAVIGLLVRAYKWIITRHWKIKLGVIQILDDGSVVEALDQAIKASSDLPFDGHLLASHFARYLTLRESGYGANHHGLLSTYLFKWETAGMVQTQMMSDSEVRLTFNDTLIPTEEIELELYQILNSNEMFSDSGFNSDLLQDWGKKVLALGEARLLETSAVAFDQKGRIRFTKQGYDHSLSHRSFEKYFKDLSVSTFCKMDIKRQEQELSFALCLGLTDQLVKLVDSNGKASEVLQIANRAWRVLS